MMTISDDLYDMALRLIVDFINSKQLSSAHREFGRFCATVVRPQPKKALAKLIPVCLRRIKEEMDHLVSLKEEGNPYHENKSSSLSFAHSVLRNVIKAGSPEVLAYATQLNEVLDQAFAFQTRFTNKMASKLLKNLLKSLTSIYQREFRIANRDTWESRGEMC
jgi:proteasome activator subunit 4